MHFHYEYYFMSIKKNSSLKIKLERIDNIDKTAFIT